MPKRHLKRRSKTPSRLLASSQVRRIEDAGQALCLALLSMRQAIEPHVEWGAVRDGHSGVVPRGADEVFWWTQARWLLEMSRQVRIAEHGIHHLEGLASEDGALLSVTGEAPRPLTCALSQFWRVKLFDRELRRVVSSDLGRHPVAALTESVLSKTRAAVDRVMRSDSHRFICTNEEIRSCDLEIRELLRGIRDSGPLAPSPFRVAERLPRNSVEPDTISLVVFDLERMDYRVGRGPLYRLTPGDCRKAGMKERQFRILESLGVDGHSEGRGDWVHKLNKALIALLQLVRKPVCKQRGGFGHRFAKIEIESREFE